MSVTNFIRDLSRVAAGLFHDGRDRVADAGGLGRVEPEVVKPLLQVFGEMVDERRGASETVARASVSWPTMPARRRFVASLAIAKFS